MMMFYLISVFVLVSTIFLPIHARHHRHHHRCHGAIRSTTPAPTPLNQTCASGTCSENGFRSCTCFFRRIQVSVYDIFGNGNLPGVTYSLSPLVKNCAELLNHIGTDGGRNKCYQTSSLSSGAPCFCDKNVSLPSNATSPPAVQPAPCCPTKCAARSYQYCFCNNVATNTSGIVELRPIPANVTAHYGDYCYNQLSQPPNAHCYNNGQICGCEQIPGTAKSQCVCKLCFECASWKQTTMDDDK